MISMKVNTKLAIALFASASSLFGLASGALAGPTAPTGGAQVTNGNPNAYNSRNAAAAATFTTINVFGVTGTTGSASAAIGKQTAAATASSVIGAGFNFTGEIPFVQGGIVNNATAIGSDSDITVNVGGTGAGGAGTGEINLNSGESVPSIQPFPL
jgi:hypothetical protein